MFQCGCATLTLRSGLSMVAGLSRRRSGKREKTKMSERTLSANNAGGPGGLMLSLDAPAGARAELSGLPGWNLADLYPGIDSPVLARDLEQAASDAESFAARYQNKLAEIAGRDGASGLYRVLAEYE